MIKLNVNLKEISLQDYEERFKLRLQESTFINDFQTELNHFREIKAFEEIRTLIISEFEKQLYMLAELRGQIDNFTSAVSIEKSRTAIEKSFDNYDEQEKKSRSALANLLLPNFSEHFKEKNNFSIALLDHRIPLQLAELSIEGNAKIQFDACIQLIESHCSFKDIAFKTTLETLKNSYLDKPALSQFIFVAHTEAFLALKQRIKNNLLDLNVAKVKKQYSAHQDLFFNFYRENIINLVGYYQNYHDNIADLESKLNFLAMNVGDSIKDWLDNYRQQVDLSSFLSEPTQENLKEKCDVLLQFKKQLKINNSTEFLQEVKSKIRKFLVNEIDLLNQQSRDYQTVLAELASVFNLSANERDKLLETKQLECSAIQKTWIARKDRLNLIKKMDELKNFNKHFPKEQLFISNSLDLEKTALHSAFLILKESNSIKKNENLIESLSKISIADLSEKIFLILKNKDGKQLYHSVNNLLLFIHAESANATINEAKTHFANDLKTFFTTQIEKTASFLVQTLDGHPHAITIKADSYQNLLNYLRLFDLTELKNRLNSNLSLREKINDSYLSDSLTPNQIDQSIERLISTKKLLDLFEGGEKNVFTKSTNDSTVYSLWDACCLFQKFSENQSGDGLECPFIKEDNTKKILLNYVKAEIDLNSIIHALIKAETYTYHSTVFLKPDPTKQKIIKTLINDLKNIPITQADRTYINDFFATWKDNHQQIINKPRYRFLIGLFMIIYRYIMERFNSSTFESKSFQTVNHLQELFSEACDNLKQLKSSLNPFCSVLNDNQEEQNLVQPSRSLN